MIISFCGKMGSGKDTFGDRFKKLYPDSVRLSFADPLRMELSSFIYCLKEDIENVDKVFNVDKQDVYNIINIIGGEDFIDTVDIRYKDGKVRKLLQYWGNMRRKQDSLYWVKAMQENIKFNNGKDIYITDTRFLNEMNMLKEIGATLILLTSSEENRKQRMLLRDGVVPTEEAMNDISETECDLFKEYDYVVDTDNISLEEIEETLIYILKKGE